MSDAEHQQSQMTPEERADFDAAMARRDRLEAEHAELLELKSQASASAQRAASLRAEIERVEANTCAMQERLAGSQTRLLELKIDELVGVKFYPEDREAMLELARELGFARVERIAASRPDIRQVDPTRGIRLVPEPEPHAEDGSDDIVRAALDAARQPN